MDLKTFARETVKVADAKAMAGKAWRWFTTAPLKASKDVKANSEVAKKVMQHAGGKLSRRERMDLSFLAKGEHHLGSASGSKKFLKEQIAKHDVRKTSLKKPVIAAAVGAGTIAGARSARNDRRVPIGMMDRSPQLIQDPSRVVY